MVRLYALKIQKKKNYENPTGNSEVDGETVCFENTKKKKIIYENPTGRCHSHVQGVDEWITENVS